MSAFRKLRTRLGLRKPRLKDSWPWSGIHVGRYTYDVTPKSIHGYDETVDFSIGAFCSIAKEVMLADEFLRELGHCRAAPSTPSLTTR